MNRLSDTSEIAQALLDGKVGVLPTDTVYGLVATAGNKQAVAKIYALKQREEKPGTVIAASVDQLAEIGVDKASLAVAQQYWPGPVSVILPEVGPQYLHFGNNSLAVRIPDDKLLLEILQVTGPLVSSSANISGEPTASSIEEAYECFGDKVDFYVDGGESSNRLPSTIVKITDGVVSVLRQGAGKV